MKSELTELVQYRLIFTLYLPTWN